MRKSFFTAVVMCATIVAGSGVMSSCNNTTTSKGFPLTSKGYPMTQKVDSVDVYFGDSVPDHYRWLENDTTRETAEWVDAQNEVTENYLSKIPFRKELKKRLTEVYNYERIGSPFKHNGRYYFYKNDGLQNQSVLYTKETLDGEAKVFLDPNTLSDDGTVALNDIEFAKSGKYAAYSITRGGSDWEEIFVIDMATGKLLDDHVLWVKVSGIAWAGDGFFYSAYDAPEDGKELSNVNENHKIYFHKIGTKQADDKLIYSNPKYPKRFYMASTNSEEDLLFIYEDGAGMGNALYVKDLTRENAPFVTISASMDYQVSPIENIGGTIYLYTNYKAPMGRVVAVTANKPKLETAKEIIAESEHAFSSVGVFGGKLLLTYSEDVCSRAYVYTLGGERLHEVVLPALGTAKFSGTKDDVECFYSFASFTTPGTIYKYDIDKNTSEMYISPNVDFNDDEYITKQIFFESKDGTRVPMFVTHKKDVELNGDNPTLIYGYGGFNISIDPAFSPLRIPFLEKGGIYVSVNMRGGSEYGESWHQAGIKMQKQNVFDDFIAAAEYLVDNGYTNPSRIAIMGGSNGGLLVGACMIQRPDLYKAVVASVGVMDMLRYQHFTIGWNWAPDYGTSADSEEMYRYLKAYSPLHTLKEGVSYPACLITTADHDDRVVPAHSFKFAARLQECNAADTPSIIRIDKDAGHGGGKPVSKIIDEYTDEYAFIMHNLGMKW